MRLHDIHVDIINQLLVETINSLSSPELLTDSNTGSTSFKNYFTKSLRVRLAYTTSDKPFTL